MTYVSFRKAFSKMHLGTAHRPFPTHKYSIGDCLIHFETTPFCMKEIPIYRPSASAVKLALIARSHPAPLGDLLRCPTSSSALKSLPYLSTAATRSARFICRRQRSHRSHTVTIPVLQIPIYRAVTIGFVGTGVLDGPKQNFPSMGEFCSKALVYE